MTGPTIFLVVRRDRDLGDSVKAYAFLESEARTYAQLLNSGDEWGPHVVEEVQPLPESSG